MAPLRRYLRITKYSVLEVRIYLDNPILAETWLLNPRSPVLPRVIEAVRPLVLPKLREENERSKGKGGAKKKGVKDVITEEDFEVSIFLTDTSTRHSLLNKQKFVRDKDKPAMQSNSSRLTGNTNDKPIDLENTGSDDDFEVMNQVSTSNRDTPIVLREESDDEGGLGQLPDANEVMEDTEAESRRKSKRQRTTRQVADDDSDDSLFAEEDPDSDIEVRPSKRFKKGTDQALLAEDEQEVAGDDKKKMATETRYDGFSIYGRVLCLVIKPRNPNKGRGRPGFGGGGSAMMEDWIRSTQLPGGMEEEG